MWGRIMAVLAPLVWGGCMTPATMYPYRIQNKGCNCERFQTRDGGVRYAFTASYKVDDGISTRVTIEITNGSRDTLDLSLAHVKIASRNVPYRYNDRFLQVTLPAILPGETTPLTLTGDVEEVKTGDPWLAVAGEELTVTLKGVRAGDRELARQVVRMVPHNPRLAH
jgi:hypothetical protein